MYCGVGGWCIKVLEGVLLEGDVLRCWRVVY